MAKKSGLQKVTRSVKTGKSAAIKPVKKQPKRINPQQQKINNEKRVLITIKKTEADMRVDLWPQTRSRKPSPTDFGVTEEDIRNTKNIQENLGGVIFICITLGLFLLWNSLGLIFWLVAIFLLCLIGMLHLFSSKYRNVSKYLKKAKEYEEWWVRTQSDFWKSLDGIQFERELAALYNRLGFQAETTTASDDKGVDIWLSKGGTRIPVQCKAHKIPIGPGAARELYGTMKHFGCRRGVLASVSGFTKGVYDYVSDKHIELLGLSDILQMQQKLELRKS